jgi:hypothetical protein
MENIRHFLACFIVRTGLNRKINIDADCRPIGVGSIYVIKIFALQNHGTFVHSPQFTPRKERNPEWQPPAQNQNRPCAGHFQTLSTSVDNVF